MTGTDAPADYDGAFRELLGRIQRQISGAAPGMLPLTMYLAGGAALHLHTGERVTEDVDATFSKRVVFGDDIQVSYRDADGRARMLYLDRNYNDSLGLLHEDAYEESQAWDVPGIDRNLVEVRVLSPVDLAVSKLARFSDQDRTDIEALAKRGLLDPAALRKRAEHALAGYVGDLAPVRNSIDVACRLVEAWAPKRRRKTRPEAGPRRRG